MKPGFPFWGLSLKASIGPKTGNCFRPLLQKLGLVQPDNGTAMSVEGAMEVAESIGYPVVVRPSYVLGGRAMKIVYDWADLETFTRLAIEASPGHPVLIGQISGKCH